jgi:hypothetical protein
MILQNKKFSATQWAFILILMTSIWTGAIFTFNYAIDPFGNREWIATQKYKPIVHERSEKYTMIFEQNNLAKYDCLILGSSRVMSIVPSENNATQSCYNFGVHTANNPEKLFILQEWLKHSPLKTVYLGNELHNVHPWMNPLELHSQRFIKGSEGNFLSYSTLSISYKVLKNRLFDKPQTYFKKDGSIYYFQDESNIQNKRFDHTLSHFKQISIEAVEGNFVQHSFIYEPKALEPLREIKTLCDQYHIKLYPFITPTFYEAQQQMKFHPSLVTASQQFRNDLIDIFGNVYDFDVDTPENRNPSNFYDPYHYRPIIGNLIINRMKSNNGYGKLFVKPL